MESVMSENTSVAETFMRDGVSAMQQIYIDK